MSFANGLIIFFITFLIIISLSLVGYIICLPNSNKVDIREIECDCEDEEKRWLKMLNTAVSNVGKECQLSAESLKVPLPNQLTIPNEPPKIIDRTSVPIPLKKAINDDLTTKRLGNAAFFDKHA